MRNYAGEVEAPRPDTIDVASLDKAVAEYAIAVAMDPSSGEALDSLAACFQHRGDTHDGRAKSNLYRVAKLLLTLELEGEARPFYRRALQEQLERLEHRSKSL